MTQEHNKAVLRTLEEGDLVTFDRVLFLHWGVYIGDGNVVHLISTDVKGTLVDSSASNVLTNSENGIHNGCVKQEKLVDVALNSKVEKNNNKDRINPPLPREEIKRRALKSVETRSYNVLSKNCEHFAAWCRNDINKSEQVDTALASCVFTGSAVVVVGGGLAIMTLTDGNDSNMKTRDGVDLKLLAGIERLFHAPFTGGIDRSMKTWDGVDLGLLTGIGRLFYAPFTGGIDKSLKTWDGVDLGLLTGIGRLFYAPFTGGIDRSMTYEIMQKVGLEWLLPGGEMMERALSGLGHKYYSIGWEKFAALCRNGISVSFQVNTALTVAGVVVAAVVVGWVAYKLYVHREKVARRIKNCCSLVANGIRSIFGKLFSW